MLKRPRAQIHDFKIAWICALQVEVDAARVALDEEYDDIHHAAGYILGQIGRHNVVILCPPAGQIGIGAAAVRAERLNATFPNIQYWLMVGVGGGVPSPTADIRLGDVVISQPQGAFGGVVQYDMGKIGPRDRHLRTGSLNAPPQDLLTAVTKFRSNVNIGRSDLQSRLLKQTAKGMFRRPTLASDVLFEASYEHNGGNTCSECSAEQIVLREDRSSTDIDIHYGLIASGNRVIKDGIIRDTLAKELGGALCFEMEAAGLMNSFPCLVVRGVCDYADSHKNKAWQPFAAMAAASCAREILSCVSIAPAEGNIGLTGFQPELSLLSRTSTQTTFFEKSSSISVTGAELREVPTERTTLADCTLSEQERQECFRSLRFDQLESRHLTVKIAHSKTCRWLIQRCEFNDWLDNGKLEQHGGFLWIKGKAATGKSTIMKFLLSHIRQTKASNNTVAFFFNARGAAIEKTTRGMYQSILYQLLQQCSDLKNVFDCQGQRVEPDGSMDWTIEILQLLFNSAVERLGRRSLIVLIDALDECDDDEVQNMVKFFGNLSHIVIASGTTVRVLFSSRHYPYISVEQGISLVLEDQAEHDEDMISYLETELKAGQGPKATKIRQKILERASGIFLWAVLVVDILNNEYRRGRIHAMEKRLEEVPDGVEKLFDDILNRGGPCSMETATCFQFVLFAKRPLTLEELYFAMMAWDDPSSITWIDEPEITKEDMERYILDVSRGLLEATRSKSGTVQFIHESVQEFFLQGKGSCRYPFAPADTFTARSHRTLRDCCNSYIEAVHKVLLAEFGVLVFVHASPEQREKIVKAFPLIQYASDTVLFHSDAAGSHGICQKDFVLGINRIGLLEIINMLQQYESRYYLIATGFLHVLADQNLLNLAKIEVDLQKAWHTFDERDLWLILSGVASVSEDGLSLVTDLLIDKSNPSRIVSDLSLDEYELEEAIRSLRQHRRSISYEPSLLCWAIRNRQISMVQLRVLSEPVLAYHIQYSIQRNDIQMLRMILPHFEFSSTADMKRVFYFANMYDHEDIDVCLVDALALRESTRQCGMCLSEAAGWGSEFLVELLLDIPDIDVNFREGRSDTPLHRAIIRGDLRIVKLLLAHPRIRVNLAGFAMETPLVIAIKQRDFEVVSLLLEHPKIDVNTAGVPSETPLVIAICTGRLDIIELLLTRFDIDVNLRSVPSGTPLMRAISTGRPDIIDLLLEHSRININYAQSDGKTALHYIMRVDEPSRSIIMEVFLRHKSFQIKANELALRDVIYEATDTGQVALLKEIMKACNLSFNSPMLQDLNLLHVASERWNPDMIGTILYHDTELLSLGHTADQLSRQITFVGGPPNLNIDTQGDVAKILS